MLYKDAMEKCIMMDKTTVSDGRGGFNTKYVDGAEFDAAVTYLGSALDKVAEALTEKASYRITTFKNVYLQPLSVFRRASNGEILRVTKESHDNQTPPVAGINMRVVDAESFIPAEYNNGQVAGNI